MARPEPGDTKDIRAPLDKADSRTARPGCVVVVSGPSGVGKGTVLRALFDRCPLPLVASVSATTRSARGGEVDGVHYHFMTPEEFQRRREAGEFLECFEVFAGGHWYGTLRAQVDEAVERGQWIVLEIDVNGAMAVMAEYAEAISIFIRLDCWEELEARLRGRGTESEDAVQRRLGQARSEMAAADRYQYQVINDNVERAAQEICDILLRHGRNKNAR